MIYDMISFPKLRIYLQVCEIELNEFKYIKIYVIRFHMTLKVIANDVMKYLIIAFKVAF